MIISQISKRNGDWSDWDALTPVPPFAAGLQFGIAVFEGMQAHLNAATGVYEISFLRDNYTRLTRSAAVLSIAVPPIEHFEAGLKKEISTLCDIGTVRPNDRIYLRTVHFSGVEEIFPSSDYPYLAGIFARPVPSIKSPATIEVLADRSFVRAIPTSQIGAAKSAVNYARLIEENIKQPLSGNQMRLWLTPDEDRFVEELDTMSVGFVMNDDRIVVPPQTSSRLQSVTMTNLLRALQKKSVEVTELGFDLSWLEDSIASGNITTFFAASTGKGIAICNRLTIAGKTYKISQNKSQIKSLFHAFSDMYG